MIQLTQTCRPGWTTLGDELAWSDNSWLHMKFKGVSYEHYCTVAKANLWLFIGCIIFESRRWILGYGDIGFIFQKPKLMWYLTQNFWCQIIIKITSKQVHKEFEQQLFKCTLQANFKS